jgi:hypothetical protein
MLTTESGTSTWDEQRFERLLRLAASLQGSLPAALPSADDAPRRAKIESRAYEIYLRRGGTDGRDFDDWLCAEREVLAKFPQIDPRLRVVLAFGMLNGL